MAEIRISAGDLRKIQQAQQTISRSVANLDARQIERMTTDVAGRLNAGIGKLLENIEKVQARFGVTDTASQRSFRRGLETAEGATRGVSSIAPYAALLSSSPQVRIGVLVASAALGAIEGAGREGTRRRIAQAVQAEEDAEYQRFLRLRKAEKDHQRELAALRGAGKLR